MIVHGVDLTKLVTPKPAQFERLIGKSFRLNTVPEPVSIRLDEVIRRPPMPHLSAQAEPFILIFSSDPTVQLIEGEYDATPDGDSTVKLYMIPVVGAPPRRRYQVIYN